MKIDVENFPGFSQGVMGHELMENMRNQSLRFGTRILSETVTDINLKVRPFEIKTDKTTVKAHTVIIATGATAKRMPIKGKIINIIKLFKFQNWDFRLIGAGDDEFWQKGISACAVCDGAVPMFRNKPLAVIYSLRIIIMI